MKITRIIKRNSKLKLQLTDISCLEIGRLKKKKIHKTGNSSPNPSIHSIQFQEKSRYVYITYNIHVYVCICKF